MFWGRRTTVVTHSSRFHADDVFAVATVSLALKGKIKVIRTRDRELIDKADIVLDVGGAYDPATHRYDHHQTGGAGERDNGVPYASFGLAWKHFSDRLCSPEVAKIIDRRLVQTIDGNDNGVPTYKMTDVIALPYVFNEITHIFGSTWKEKDRDQDKAFMQVVDFAKEILKREIIVAQDTIEGNLLVKAAYDAAPDKRLIELDGSYMWLETLVPLPEPMYVLYPSKRDGTWKVEAVRKNFLSFETRKPFPESWAGKIGEKMAEASGVPDAVMCHNKRFLAVAKSREGALALAHKALEG